MIRPLSFLGLLIVAAVSPMWLVVALGIGYGFVFAGLELVVLAVFVDAFFMTSNTLVPFYTLGAIVLLAVVEIIKPYVLFYNQPS